jgi:mannosylglycerate hydrolase
MLQTVDYEYAIYPHKGDWVDAQVYAEADTINAKPAAVQISMNKGGDLPISTSHYSIDNEAVVMTAFKKSEDRDSVILRLHNPTEASQAVTIKCGLPVTQAWLNNLNEVRGEAVDFKNGALTLNVAKGKIITVEFQ